MSATLRTRIVKVLGYLEAGGSSRTFNLGTASGASVWQIIDAVERVIGRRVPHSIGPGGWA